MTIERIIQPDNSHLRSCQEQTEHKQLKRKVILNRCIYFISALVALPTSILSGFAALEGDHGNLKSLDSFHAIANLIMNQTAAQFLYGFICLLATTIVLTGLNKKYLLGSTKSVLDLIRNNFIYIKSKFSSNQFDKPMFSYIENGLLIWCFMTSLIFAELGKETLAFLGAPGALIGFYLNLVVYFATRFAGARRFFKSVIEKNKVEISSEKIHLKEKIMQKVPLIAGYILAFVFAIPIITNFIPECVQGLQMLLHCNLNADPKYQNLSAVTLGLFATLPTVFFYSISIKDLPKHLVNTTSLFHQNVRSNHYKSVLQLLLFTLLAFAASYFAGIGFRLVGTSNIAQGYLSYMNDGLASWMPAGLFIACVLMFWSHLQHLVNEFFARNIK